MKWWWHALPNTFFAMDVLFGLLMKKTKRIKYTTMDWLGIALKAVIQRWTAPRASRPGAIQSQGRKGRSSWAFKTPNACCSTKKFLNTADSARWCFIWDPGFNFFWCLIPSAGGTSKHWRQLKIHQFLFGQEMTRDCKWILSKIWSGWTARRKSAAVGKHPWAQTSPK